MYDIKGQDVLARVHKYELLRSDGHIRIDVLEVIAGKSSQRFIAVPNLVLETADKMYHGFGDSVEAALQDCLNKIKDVSSNVVVFIPAS